MIASWHPSERTRFIVRRGILRFGLAMGIVAAWLAAVPSSQLPEAGASRVTALLGPPTLAFLEWGIGGGWVVGAVLWELSRRRANAARREPSPARRRR